MTKEKPADRAWMDGEPILLVGEDEPRELWLEKRAEGVSASEVYGVAHGSPQRWRQILDDKLNGSRFRGTADTRRGVEREAALVEYAIEAARGMEELPAEARATLRPNRALWLYWMEQDRLMATPDGISDGPVGERIVVEVKSHGPKWKGSAYSMPPEHVAQVQAQMLVMGASHAVYCWEQVGEDGEALAAPTVWVVERDTEYQKFLLLQVCFFRDWRLGRPLHRPHEATDSLLQEWIDAKQMAEQASAAQKRTEEALKKQLVTNGERPLYGGFVMGEQGGALIIAPMRERIDEDLVPPVLAARQRELISQMEAVSREIREVATVVEPGQPYLRLLPPETEEKEQA